MCFSGTYDREDVLFLLEDDPSIPLVDLKEKERLMQAGVHYSDILSKEALPSEEHRAFFYEACERYNKRISQDVLSLATYLRKNIRNCVLVSLVRAGTPLGVLLVRAMRYLGYSCPHYGISIIRDRGIDHVALNYIREKHPKAPLVFIDGWTGKGSIARELRKSVPTSFLVTLSDIGGFADLSVSTYDWLIPFGMMNAIISGGISRSVWSSCGFHKCRFYGIPRDKDISQAYVTSVAQYFSFVQPRACSVRTEDERRTLRKKVDACIAKVAKKFAITSVEKIKPGLAEAGRALMRRNPKVLLIKNTSVPDTKFLQMQAARRDVPITIFDTTPYAAIVLLL